VSYDVEKFMAGELIPDAPQLRGLAGFIDRRHETEHLLRQRQARRGAEMDIIREQRKLIEQQARLSRRARMRRELKLELQRADIESRIIAAENPELRQKCALLDDDFFQLERAAQLKDQ